jgi:hypothetical protein
MGCWIANRYSRRLLLLTAAVLMVTTGVGFVAVTGFWPLLVIAVVGTMNPTSGDASIFVPLEQTVPFGWPLLIGGVIKGVYDILLLIKFQKVRPPEEAGAAAE